MKLASFDIFDTVLIRKCGRPENIFHLLAGQLYPDNVARREAFVHHRMQANGQVVKQRGCVEVTLAQICEVVYEKGFAEYTSHNLEEAEKRIERENLITYPDIQSTLETMRQQGYTVCFISDMYLDAPFLESILREQGCLKGDEKVWVSSEHQARKDRGTLYDVVREYYHPASWVHHGDHPHSDVRMARKKGIEARRIDTGYTAVEQALCRKNAGGRLDDFSFGSLAAWARFYRLQKANEPLHAAVDFVAAIYVPYVHYILERAKEAGIKRLYFLSRDGYILMRIAQKLVRNEEIEICYLYVSRRALLLPYLAGNVTRKQYMGIQECSLRGQSVDKLLKHLDTDREALAKYGLTFSYTRIAGAEQQSDFLQKLFDSEFLPELSQKADAQLQLLRQYFHQEKLDDGVKAAMVDVGWLGTSRKMVNHILQKMECDDMATFYLGTRADVLPLSSGLYYSYLPCGKHPWGLTALIEHHFSASPYKTTVGYALQENLVMPVFDGRQVVSPDVVVRANIEAVEYIADELQKAEWVDEKILYAWAQHAISHISTLDLPVDISPLAVNADFDGVPFVGRLSLGSLFQMLLLGKTITGFDRASLQYTLGYRWAFRLWPMREFTGKVRGLLYRCMLKYHP